MESKVVEFYSLVYGLSTERIAQEILPKIEGDYP
jgi:hypothetical protein